MSSVTGNPKVIRNPKPSVPLAALYQFDIKGTKSTRISLSDGQIRRELCFDYAYDAIAGLPLLGMYEGRDHDISVKVDLDDGFVVGPGKF